MVNLICQRFLALQMSDCSIPDIIKGLHKLQTYPSTYIMVEGSYLNIMYM